MNKKVHKYLFIIVAFAILFCYIFLKYPWWVLASLSEFRLWYSNTGVLLWITKSVLFLIGTLSVLSVAVYALRPVVIYTIIVFKNNKFQNIYINTVFFIVMVIGGWYFKTEHPFCDFPMYNSFPNWSVVFAMEDINGKQLPLSTFSNYSASDIPDLYFNFMNNAHEPYGRLESNEWALKAGAEIGRKIKLKQELKGGFKLVRIYYHIKNHKIVEERTVLYERNI